MEEGSLTGPLTWKLLRSTLAREPVGSVLWYSATVYFIAVSSLWGQDSPLHLLPCREGTLGTPAPRAALSAAVFTLPIARWRSSSSEESWEFSCAVVLLLPCMLRALFSVLCACERHSPFSMFGGNHKTGVHTVYTLPLYSLGRIFKNFIEIGVKTRSRDWQSVQEPALRLNSL